MNNITSNADSASDVEVPATESLVIHSLNEAVTAALSYRTKRDGVMPDYSDDFLIKTGAIRGFTLLNIGLDSIAGRFTAEEIVCVLAARPTETWSTYTDHLLAFEFARAYGLRSDSPVDLTDPGFNKRMHTLKKLQKLSPLETMALTDFCERWWQSRAALSRGPDQCASFRDMCTRLGLELAA